MAATNSAFRTETRDEHLYNHIELFGRSSSPIDAPAANRYQDHGREQQPTENQIATGRRMYSDYRTESINEHLYNNIQSTNKPSSPATESQAAFRAESSHENLYDHIELSNTQSLPRCLPSGATPVNQTYQEEAVYQNDEGNNRQVATNSAFRADPNDERPYDHIELSNRQPVPSRAPTAYQIYQEEAANQNYEGNNRPVATNSAFKAEPNDEHLYDHIELSNRQPVPSRAPTANQIYQEEAANQNYEGNNRPVATNSAFRAEPNDEHLYNHIELSNRQPVPSEAPAENQIYQEEAASQTYEGNNRPQEPMRNIAKRHRMSFAMIAVPVLCLLAVVGLSISLAIMMSSDGCPSDWTHFKSYCYFVSKERKSWDHAQDFCLERGGELVEITSFEENECVFKLVKKRESSLERVWIGLKYYQEVNKFLWSDKTAPYFKYWPNFTEPQGNASKPCVYMFTLHNGESSKAPGSWNDVTCGSSYGFVCKKLQYLSNN